MPKFLWEKYEVTLLTYIYFTSIKGIYKIFFQIGMNKFHYIDIITSDIL